MTDIRLEDNLVQLMEVLQTAVAGVEAALQHVTRLVAVLVRQPVVRAAAVAVHCNTSTAAQLNVMTSCWEQNGVLMATCISAISTEIERMFYY